MSCLIIDFCWYFKFRCFVRLQVKFFLISFSSMLNAFVSSNLNHKFKSSKTNSFQVRAQILHKKWHYVNANKNLREF